MLRLIVLLNDYAQCKSSCCDAGAVASQHISREEFKLNVMHSSHFDSLHRYPLCKDGSLSDEYSDFPPIREGTPDHSSSSEEQPPPLPKKGLGQRNAPKSSSKRGLKVEVANERPSRKRQHHMLESDLLKGEFADIRTHITDVREHLRDSFIFIDPI